MPDWSEVLSKSLYQPEDIDYGIDLPQITAQMDTDNNKTTDEDIQKDQESSALTTFGNTVVASILGTTLIWINNNGIF